MPRYAKPNQTIDNLKKKILEVGKKVAPDVNWDHVYGGDVAYAAFQTGIYRPGKIAKDLSKVEFDCENLDFASEQKFPGAEDLQDFEVLNGVPVAWISAGGDWEWPLAFVFYIGDDGSLRAYIPNDGNAYNKKTKMAFGNEEDEDEFDEDRDWIFDSDKLREDVKARIQLKV